MTTPAQPKPSSSNGSAKEPSEVYHLGRQALADSRRWFPNTSESVAFTCLALAGEVGELCNLVKKIERGTAQWGDAKIKYDIHMEVADIFTYLMDLAGQLNVDLVRLYELKRIENERRFGHHE